MKCAGCLRDIQDEEKLIKCTTGGCQKSFHAACTNAARLTKEESNLWICPNCTAAAKKGGDNSCTPVRGGASDNVTRRKPQHGTGPGVCDPTNFAEAFLSLSTEISLLRQSTTDMRDSLNLRLDELGEKMSSFDSRLKTVEKLESENTILKATVADLQFRLDSQAQASLRNEVEVYGLEETPEENPYHLVLTTAVKLGVDLHDTDLAFVSRVGPKHPGGSSENEATLNKQRLPRPIAVAFVRRAKRDDFLKQAKVRRNIKSRDIVQHGSDKKVYINERLTSANRRLFRNARTFAKDHGYKYCWVRNGNILVRRQEAARGSPAILIRTDEDLVSLRLPAETEMDLAGGAGT